MPMTVEYRNGVQSSTISYSNMVIPEGITKHTGRGLKPLSMGELYYSYHITDNNEYLGKRLLVTEMMNCQSLNRLIL